MARPKTSSVSLDGFEPYDGTAPKKMMPKRKSKYRSMIEDFLASDMPGMRKEFGDDAECTACYMGLHQARLRYDAPIVISRRGLSIYIFRMPEDEVE